MNAISDVDSLVKRMVGLLLLGGGGDWAATLEQVQERFDGNIVDMTYGFLSMYGGVGQSMMLFFTRTERCLSRRIVNLTA